MYSLYLTFTASRMQRVINTPSFRDVQAFRMRLRTGAGCTVRVWDHKNKRFV